MVRTKYKIKTMFMITNNIKAIYCTANNLILNYTYISFTVELFTKLNNHDFNVNI